MRSKISRVLYKSTRARSNRLADQKIRKEQKARIYEKPSKEYLQPAN